MKKTILFTALAVILCSCNPQQNDVILQNDIVLTGVVKGCTYQPPSSGVPLPGFEGWLCDAILENADETYYLMGDGKRITTYPFELKGQVVDILDTITVRGDTWNKSYRDGKTQPHLLVDEVIEVKPYQYNIVETTPNVVMEGTIVVEEHILREAFPNSYVLCLYAGQKIYFIRCTQSSKWSSQREGEYHLVPVAECDFYNVQRECAGVIVRNKDKVRVYGMLHQLGEDDNLSSIFSQPIFLLDVDSIVKI